MSFIGDIGGGVRNVFGDLLNGAGQLKNDVGGALGFNAPPAQNYGAIANQMTQANRPNQSNAAGAFSNWTQDPNGNWTQSSGFNGPLGQANNSLLGQAANNFSKPFDFGQYGPIGNGDQARDQAITGAYNQATSRLNPMWDQREAAQRTQLMNQGLDPTSEAGRNAMNSLGQQRNDAYSSAMNGAIAQGTAAGSSAFQNNMAAHQQQVGEGLQAYNMPMQGLQSLYGLTGQQGVQPGANTLGAAMGQDQYNLGAQQAQNSNWADMIKGFTGGVGGAVQGGGSLAGGILANPAASAGVATLAAPLIASDERVKHSIHRWGAEALPGVQYASWIYKEGFGTPGVHLGVIAQDLEAAGHSQYVHEINGVKHVDYSFLDA